MKRLSLIFLALALLVIVPFVIWGDQFEQSMSLEKTVAWLRSTGSWAWAAGMGLLVIDLFLPILGTVVMSALGLVYGWFWGGLLSAAGSIGAGLLAYGLSRKLGRRAVRFLAGENGLAEGERLFGGETGGWLVAFSRWMPVLPEVVACLAGISKMPFKRFLAALCAGCFPMGFVFAWIGETGNERPLLALILSAGLPPLIWGAFRFFYQKRREGQGPLLLPLLRFGLALVWLVMGLGCKVLEWAPRHEEIVARILGPEFAPSLVQLIGWSEVGIALWILSGIRPRICAWFQVILVATMNVIELILARDLLLFGWVNGLVALGFIAMIMAHERLRLS